MRIKNIALNIVTLPAMIAFFSGCMSNNPTTSNQLSHPTVADLQVVDCLLPGQVRQLGNKASYITARRPTNTTAADCRIRGGEYVAYDRANLKSSLNVWMPAAQAGNAEAQANVGEIFERGIGGSPNYEAAVIWYSKAAQQGNSRAQFNLGTLYEQGFGVPKSKKTALNWYRKAWGLASDTLIYQSSAKVEQQAIRSRLQGQISAKSSQLGTLNSQMQVLQTQLEKQNELNNQISASSRANSASSAEQLAQAKAKSNAKTLQLQEKNRQERQQLVEKNQREKQQILAKNQREAQKLLETQQLLAAKKLQAQQLESQKQQQLQELEAKNLAAKRALEAEQLQAQNQQETQKVNEIQALLAKNKLASQKLQQQNEQQAIQLQAQHKRETEKLLATQKMLQENKLQSAQQLAQIKAKTQQLLAKNEVETQQLLAENELQTQQLLAKNDIKTQQLQTKNSQERRQLQAQVAQLRNQISTLEEEKANSEQQITQLPVFRQPPKEAVQSTSADSENSSISAKGVKFGRYFALVIGNQNYSSLDSLATPKKDAQQVASVLESKYGFSVQLLLDASNIEVMKAINNLNSVLKEDDNLLIFYAGHGSRVSGAAGEEGYWLPVNAEQPPEDTFWVSNEFVTRHLSRIKAKRVLVVADSCYAGLLSSAPSYLFMGGDQNQSNEYLKYKLAKKSRLILSSGGDKPVLDNAGQGNSVFARAFLQVLKSNREIMAGPQLFLKLRDRVVRGAKVVGYNQVPEFKAIKGAGHEVGDFFFVPTT